MKTNKRKSSEVRNRAPRPMRGGLLSDIAHAFRLRVAVVGENGDVAVGTAKHAFNDHRDVGRGRHVALVRAVVDRLFTTEYLVSRGLTPGEATRHNDHVTQAMDVILAAWDRLGVFHNVTPEKLERVEAVMGPLGLLGVELPIRIAAYHARYGFLHPVCSDLASWVRAPGIRGWGTHVSRQVRTPIVPSALYRRGELDGHTVRDLLEGRALPMEQTVRPLAARIAEHGVRDRDHTMSIQPRWSSSSASPSRSPSIARSSPACSTARTGRRFSYGRFTASSSEHRMPWPRTFWSTVRSPPRSPR